MLKTHLTRRKPIGQRSAVLKSTKPKTRKCAVKGCDNRFTARSLAHKACGPECAAIVTAADRKRMEAKAAREDRVRTKEKLAALKTKGDWMKEAQREFNAYIRARDARQPCICCGRTSIKDHLTGSSWDAGHFRSVGSAPHLRFHEDNVHRQLVHCNRHGAGRAVDYRLGLIARIGLARVEALEADQTPRHYSIDDLKAIKTTYRAKLKALKEAV